MAKSSVGKQVTVRGAAAESRFRAVAQELAEQLAAGAQMVLAAQQFPVQVQETVRAADWVARRALVLAAELRELAHRRPQDVVEAPVPVLGSKRRRGGSPKA